MKVESARVGRESEADEFPRTCAKSFLKEPSFAADERRWTRIRRPKLFQQAAHDVCVLLLIVAGQAVAQEQGPQLQFPGQPAPAPVQPSLPPPSEAEQTDLMHAVTEGANSTVDLVRVFEAYLKKYPNTNYRPDIELNILKASIENNDSARIVKYGETVLVKAPDDVVALDRVSMALADLGGKENAGKMRRSTLARLRI